MGKKSKKHNSVMVTDNIFNKDTLLRFYHNCIGYSFESITPERMIELDKSVAKWSYKFHNTNYAFRSLLCYTAEKMIISKTVYGTLDWPEKMYFFIKMVDPELKYLQFRHLYKTAEEFKAFSMSKYGICDGNLLRLEQSYARTFIKEPQVHEKSPRI